MTTSIEWTKPPGYIGETLTPAAGCRRASPGCENCYAEKLAARNVLMMRKLGGKASPYEGTLRTRPCPKCGGKEPSEVKGCWQKGGCFGGGDVPLHAWNGVVKMHPALLEVPFRWREPRCAFVESMSDILHDDVPLSFVAATLAVAAATPRHYYLLLTKRADRLPDLFDYIGEIAQELRGDVDVHGRYAYALSSSAAHWSERVSDAVPRSIPWPLGNVGIGVSVEDDTWARRRLPYLLDPRVVAGMRYVSYEPALGPVDWSPWASRLDWIIVGGESGHHARPFDLQWARDVVTAAEDTGVAAFVKQTGRLAVDDDMDPMRTAGKGNDPTAWPAWARVREYPPQMMSRATP